MACLTSASRMCYAFSRDGAIPGWRIWSRVNQRRVPVNAVIFMARLAALIITLPALTGQQGAASPVAFFAVVSIAVIGLYIAYVIPIFLRWRDGRRVRARARGRSGSKYKWMNPFAVDLGRDHHRSSSSCRSSPGGRAVGRRVRLEARSTTRRS